MGLVSAQEGAGRADTPATAPAAAQPALPPGFSQLLTERRLAFEVPPSFVATEVKPSERWRHDYAVKSTRFKLEIRYGAAPQVGPSGKPAGESGAAGPIPSGKDLEALLDTAARPLAKGGSVRKSKAFPLDAVRKEFGAHYGGIAGFDVDPAFAPYKQGAAVVLHRQGRGTVMFVALYDEMTEPLEDEWMSAFHSLRFTEPFVSPESAALGAGLSGTSWRCGDGFVRLRFLESTWSIIHISAAMAVMGNTVPFETRYYDLKYLPGSRFSARVFRVDNMERGDLTPKQPAEELFQYKRKGKKLDLRGPVKWSCELDR